MLTSPKIYWQPDFSPELRGLLSISKSNTTGTYQALPSLPQQRADSARSFSNVPQLGKGHDPCSDLRLSGLSLTLSAMPSPSARLQFSKVPTPGRFLNGLLLTLTTAGPQALPQSRPPSRHSALSSLLPLSPCTQRPSQTSKGVNQTLSPHRFNNPTPSSANRFPLQLE